MCASRASTYFVTGALGFVVAAGRLSLAGWRRHRSPGARAASPVPQLQHLPLPRGLGCLLQRPETRDARGPSGRPPCHPAAVHSTSGQAAATTRPHHGGALPRQVTPKTASTNERSRQPPGSAAPTEGRGAGAGAWGWLGAPGPSGEGGDAAQRGRRLPGARLPAEAQVGGEEGAGREAGSVTLFNASWGAGRLGPATPRPACGLRSRRPRPPHTFRRAPASRSQVTRRRPRPAPPLCAALRFPQPRLPPER